MDQKKVNQGACSPISMLPCVTWARASFLPLQNQGASSVIPKLPSAVTLSGATLHFHNLVQQKVRAQINTLNHVFAELRPEEIEKHSSHCGAGFTVALLASPFRGSLLARFQRMVSLGLPRPR